MWPIDKLRTDENTVMIAKVEIFVCQYRLDYGGQCGHKLFINYKFVMNHWSSRWYTTKLYNHVFRNNNHIVTKKMTDMLTPQTEQRIIQMSSTTLVILNEYNLISDTVCSEKDPYAT